MAYEINERGTLTLRIGESVVRVHYCRPAPGAVIDALVAKMPSGDEDVDAHNVLMANLELGRACVVGVGEDDLAVDDKPLSSDAQSPNYASDWREVVAQRAPLILIALGQYLSAAPAHMEERSLKKSSGMPGQPLAAG